MKNSKNVWKNVGIVLLSILLVGGCIGLVYAANKHFESKTSNTTTPEVSETSTTTPTSKTSSSETPGSSNDSASSSSQQSNQNESVVPTINCSLPQEVYWYNTEDQVELNESLLVATINGLPLDATDEDRELYFWSDDDDLDEWIEISRMKNGVKEVINSPYTFQSGETIHIKQVHEAPAMGFYKIPLWIYAVNYEPSEVYNCVDFWFQQR